jgi:ribosomal protein S18 acetylase RimI-like enzyme
LLTRRPIEDADAGTIIGWFADRQSALFWGGPKAPDPLTAEWLSGQFEAANYWVWTDAQNNLAGVFGLLLPETGHAHLTRFGLAPAWRGRGLGQAALQEIIAIARSREMTHLGLYVYEANRAAKRLYDAHGFTVIERDSPATAWSGDNLRMMLSL